jgi:hypothetical protein
MALDESLIGFSIDDVEVVDKPVNMAQVLNNLAADIVYCLQQNIANHNIKDTGELANSIRMPITVFGTTLTATLYLEDYFDYVNKGVRGAGGTRKTDGEKAFTGPKIPQSQKNAPWIIRAPNSPYAFTNKKPPISKLRQWCQTRNLPVFAVQEKVFRQGIKPRPFYDECIEQSFSGATWEQFKDQIQVVSAKNITRELKTSLTSNNKTQGFGPHQK